PGRRDGHPGRYAHAELECPGDRVPVDHTDGLPVHVVDAWCIRGERYPDGLAGYRAGEPAPGRVDDGGARQPALERLVEHDDDLARCRAEAGTRRGRGGNRHRVRGGGGRQDQQQGRRREEEAAQPCRAAAADPGNPVEEHQLTLRTTPGRQRSTRARTPSTTSVSKTARNTVA